MALVAGAVVVTASAAASPRPVAIAYEPIELTPLPPPATLPVTRDAISLAPPVVAAASAPAAVALPAAADPVVPSGAALAIDLDDEYAAISPGSSSNVESLRWIEVPPPYPSRYEPARSEEEPEVKRAAAAVAYELTNYDAREAHGVAAAIVSNAIGAAELAVAAAPLLHEDLWSRGTIVYPQLGGLTADRASVMVVVRQEVGIGATVDFVETRTLDIRMVRGAAGWEFDYLDDAGGQAVPRPRRLSRVARAVVDNPRIELPDSAVWDIYRGDTSKALLELMADLAEVTTYGVVTLSSGHPDEIFGTDRVSNHTVGRAVDIYLIDDRTVAASTGRRSQARAVAEWLLARPDVYNFGSPWALDGRGGLSFSDALHQDHFHIAVPKAA